MSRWSLIKIQGKLKNYRVDQEAILPLSKCFRMTDWRMILTWGNRELNLIENEILRWRGCSSWLRSWNHPRRRRSSRWSICDELSKVDESGRFSSRRYPDTESLISRFLFLVQIFLEFLFLSQFTIKLKLRICLPSFAGTCDSPSQATIGAKYFNSSRKAINHWK
jgi:hypothetical protein